MTMVSTTEIIVGFTTELTEIEIPSSPKDVCLGALGGDRW